MAGRQWLVDGHRRRQWRTVNGQGLRKGIVVDVDFIRIQALFYQAFTVHGTLYYPDVYNLLQNRMKLFLFLLLCVLCVLLFYVDRIAFHRVQETFLDKTASMIVVAPELQKKYTAFIAIYNPVMANWTKAIVSSMGLNAPPADASKTVTNAKPVIPSQVEMNKYIGTLSDTLGKPLLAIVDPLPDTLDPDMIPLLSGVIPRVTTQMINSLEWMNMNLKKTHADLDKAMKGGKPESFVGGESLFADSSPYVSEMFVQPIDGLTSLYASEQFASEQFEDPPVCQQFLQCQQEQQQGQQQKQKEAAAVFDTFLENGPLQSAFQTNQDLVATSLKIQSQAQSGALLNQLQLPSEPAISFTLPKGSNNLKDMEKSDSAKYNDYKANYSQWFSLKQMFDQVNGNLR